MNHNLFLVLVSDVMLVACVLATVMLDGLIERRRRTEAIRRPVEIGLKAKGK
jgi:hypothetical protein